MAQQHRDLRYPTVNFHSTYYTADLVGNASSRRSYYNYRGVRYDDLERALEAGQTVIGPQGSVAPAGYYLAGTSQRTGSGRGGRFVPTGNVYKKLPTPETKIEYRADPAQAERLKKLEDELKIAQARPTITPEMVEYRKQADATLAAADARLAQFAINKSAFEQQQQEFASAQDAFKIQQQEAAAAAAQRESAFQAAMKQREDIFAQTSAAKTADMAKRASAFEQQMEQQRAELAAQESERQALFEKSMAEQRAALEGSIAEQRTSLEAEAAQRESLFAKSMEEQRAALSGQTAEIGRQRTAFETEMLGARQEFAGQQEAFAKTAAEREQAYNQMVEKQRADFTKEQEAFKQSMAERGAAYDEEVAAREEAFKQMTIRQQEAFRKEQKEAEAAANRAAAVRSANQRQSELAQTIQVQPAEGATRRFAGTQGFRRRAVQFGTASPYKGLGTIQSGMVNV